MKKVIEYKRDTFECPYCGVKYDTKKEASGCQKKCHIEKECEKKSHPPVEYSASDVWYDRDNMLEVSANCACRGAEGDKTYSIAVESEEGQKVLKSLFRNVAKLKEDQD